VAEDRAEGTRRRGTALLVGLMTALLVVALAATLSACSDRPPPDPTMAALGAAVGDAKLDEVDFSALLGSFASESYGAATTSEQADYQLYLAAKAADLGLNRADTGSVQVDKRVSGTTASFSFTFPVREGLFAVADVGRIDVSLVYADSKSHPWLIESIVLSR